MQREVEGILKWGVEFDQIMSEKQDKLFYGISILTSWESQLGKDNECDSPSRD